MRRDDVQVERIREELHFIQRTCGGMKREEFLANEVIQHAITMSLITIGECANHLSDRFKEEHSQIEWVQIIAVRNIAAHGYWQLSMEQIWQSVEIDVPQLLAFFETLCARVFGCCEN